MLLKEDKDTTIQNLKNLVSKNCGVDDTYKIVTNPINNKYALYKKTEKNNWVFVYDDLTIEVVNPQTKTVLKSGKITCEGYETIEQEKSKKETENIQDILSGLTKAGWTTEVPDITSANYDMGMDIRNISSGRFAHLYQKLKDLGVSTIVYPIAGDSELDTFVQIHDPEEFKKMSEKGGLKKSECKKWIKGLYDARENNTPFTSTQLLAAKTKVFACYKQNIKFNQGAFGLGDELRELIGDIGKYGIGDFVRGSGAKMNESNEYNIKSIIKENLITSAKKKENKLLSENKIIVSRLKLLGEGIDIENKQDVERFFNLVINETAYLHSQNYDNTLIKEGFMDLMKGLFGQASESIFSYFQENIARWFVTKFTPIDPKSWLGTMIIVAIGNVPITEIHNLTNCSFVSKKLTKTIVEGTVDKIKNEQGLQGPGYDILRNALMEMAEDSSFGQKVEQKISDFICPMLQGLKGKLDAVTGKIKSGALGLG